MNTVHRFMQLLRKRPLTLWAAMTLYLFCVPAWPGLGQENRGPALNRDMVWSAYDGPRRAIYFSTQEKGGGWSEPLQLTDSRADNLLPCIVSMPDGKKYVVWTAMDDARLDVMYMVFDGGAWTEPQGIPNLPEQTTMPFVAADDDGVLWLVFVGNDGSGHDDIYCTHLRAGTWSEPMRMHAANEVPDINPFIEIGRDGAVRVTWEGFRGDGYILLSSDWLGDGWSAEAPLPQEDKEKIQEERQRLEEEELPEFIEDRSMLFIRTNE